MTEVVKQTIEDSICFIEMNRPDKRNALSPELVSELTTALKAAEKNPEVKIIILYGNGKAYSAGGDIAAFDQLKDSNAISSWMKDASSLSKTIMELDKFVISAVHGFAAGAGFSLALASDFVVADKSAIFVSSFTNIGLIPDLGLAKQLAERVPLPVAKDWIVTGRKVAAEEAFEAGLINKVSTEDAVAEAKAYASHLINSSPTANKFVKYLLNNASALTLDENFMQENMMQTILLQTEDHKNAVQSFFKKEPPTFTGK